MAAGVSVARGLAVREDSRGLSLSLSTRYHIAQAGSRHLSHSDPKSVKDWMTGCDTGEQLAGLSTKLSGSRATRFSAATAKNTHDV